MDKASAWDGSVFTATMSIVDAATAPMGAVLNAAKNPIAQGATFLGVSAGLADTVNTYKGFESMMSQVQACLLYTSKKLKLRRRALGNWRKAQVMPDAWNISVRTGEYC